MRLPEEKLSGCSSEEKRDEMEAQPSNYPGLFSVVEDPGVSW